MDQQHKDHTKKDVTMHITDTDGVWHPVILDPMGDAALEAEAAQLILEQQAERHALISRGERVAAY